MGLLASSASRVTLQLSGLGSLLSGTVSNSDSKTTNSKCPLFPPLIPKIITELSSNMKGLYFGERGLSGFIFFLHVHDSDRIPPLLFGLL
jgi:hypothetical protein